MEPIEIAVKNVVFLPEIYPRSKPDEERIELFVELIEAGTTFPPINVNKAGNSEHKGKYVLLDGYHRLDAYKALGYEKVRAFIFNFPRHQWLLKAASFNSRGSAQLKRGDCRRVILESYKEGNTTREIARDLGCSEQYVRRVLKPIRDQERKNRNDKILELHKLGLTQKQIAEKLKLAQQTVSYIVGNAEKYQKGNSFVFGTSYNPRNINELHTQHTVNSSFSKMLTPSKSPEVIYKGPPSDAGPPGKKEGLSRETEGRTPAKVSETSDCPTSAGPSTNKKTGSPSFGCNCAADKTEPRQDAEKSPAPPVDEPQPLDKGHEPSPIRKPQKVDPVKRSSIPDIVRFINEDYCNQPVVTVDTQNALRALELTKKAGWDIVDISQELSKPISFLRKVFSAAIGLALNNGRKQREDLVPYYASVLELDIRTVLSLRYGLMFKAQLAPTGPGMDTWVKDNLAESDLESIAAVISNGAVKVAADEIPAAVARGTLTERCAKPYSKLPDDIEQFMVDSTERLRIIRDLLEKDKLQGEPLNFFNKLFNKLYGVVQEVNESIKKARRREARSTEPAAAVGIVATSMELAALDYSGDDIERNLELVNRCLPPYVPESFKREVARHGMPALHEAIATWTSDGGMSIKSWIYTRTSFAIRDGHKRAAKTKLQSFDSLPLEPSAGVG